MEKQYQKDLMKQKVRVIKLSFDVKVLQSELIERQIIFDFNVELLINKIREIFDEKIRLEIELDLVQRKFEVGVVE